jgi:thiamine-monophosphate kinase
MLVSEIGEFGLIKLLSHELGIEYPPQRGKTHPGLQVGLGDDAVVSRRHEGALIWTTDTMVAGVHFKPERTAWRDTGWKALAVNLSDIAAMGGRPDLALVTLMLPPDFCVEDALELYRGLRDIADVYKVSIAGGDIVKAAEFAVTVALSGWAHASRLSEPQVMTRDAARKGDVVAVSGTLGNSAAGLRLLDQAEAFDTEAKQALRLAHERPEPRIVLGQMAVRAGVRCGMDVSDGLVQDLGHIATASQATIRIDATRIPTSAALAEVFPAQALGLALAGGEDYELLMAAPARVMEALTAASATPLTVIGEVVSADAPGVSVMDETGREIPLEHRGWDHLAARP